MLESRFADAILSCSPRTRARRANLTGAAGFSVALKRRTVYGILLRPSNTPVRTSPLPPSCDTFPEIRPPGVPNLDLPFKGRTNCDGLTGASMATLWIRAFSAFDPGFVGIFEIGSLAAPVASFEIRRRRPLAGRDSSRTFRIRSRASLSLRL